MKNQHDRINWTDEDAYWRSNFRGRPYASSSDRDYDFYEPAYRYGFESAQRFEGRDWSDVEPEISSQWNTYKYRGASAWEQVKDAVRDAWDRVTGHRHVGAH